MSSLNKNNVLSEALNWDGELLADIQNALKEKLREMDANANGGVSSISLSVNGSNQLVVEVTRADGTKRAASYDVSNMIGGGGSVVMGRIVDGLFYRATQIATGQNGNHYSETPEVLDARKLYINMPEGKIYRCVPNASGSGGAWDEMVKLHIDSGISSTSDNPVKNSAIALALSSKLEAGDIAGKADKLAGMLHPGQWPKVVVRNITASQIDTLLPGDVYFDSQFYLHTNGEPIPLGGPQEGTLYYCLADNKTYYWRGNSWNQAGGSGNGTVQSVSVNGGQPQYPNGQTGNVNLIVEAGAQGPKGDTGNVQVDGNGNVLIVNNLEDGGTGAAFSAEMGKRVAGREATDRQRIDEIVAILKKAVFTEGVSFTALDALANGIDSIYFNASSHTFSSLNETFTLSVNTDPAGKTAQIESWSSSNTSVATVNNGVVTSIADGDAVITATTQDGKVAKCAVKVATVNITEVTISPTGIQSVGDHWHHTYQLAATVKAGTQTVQTSVDWTSTNHAVATVDNNGLVTIQGNGSCTISATAGGVTGTCTVEVSGMVRTSYSIDKTLENASVLPNDANVLEGEDITLTITADASHVLDSVTVVMGSTDLSTNVEFADDNKSASISINNVSGNIAIVATATFVETNLMDEALELDGYEVDGVQVKAATGCKCKRVKLEKGKYYIIKNYTNGGDRQYYNAMLMKDDGNDGYTALLESDVTNLSNSLWKNLHNSLFNPYQNGYTKLLADTAANSFPFNDFIFATPLASEIPNVGDIYLVIDTQRSDSNKISSSFGLYGWKPKNVLTVSEILPNWRQNGANFMFGYSFGEATIFKLEKGAKYVFDNYSGFDAGGYGEGYWDVFSLLKGTGNTFDFLKSTDMKSGSTWLSNNGFFSAGGKSYIGKMNVDVSGEFTVPSDNDVDGDIYLAVTISAHIVNGVITDSVASSLTITKQTQS